MEQNRKILIVSYYWPPSGGVGVQRWMNFALQLQERGWEPTVLTPSNPQFEIKDEQLLDRVKNIPVDRIPIWEPFDLFHKLTGNKDRKNVQQGLVLEKKKRSLLDKLVVWARGNLLIPDPRRFWVKPASNRAIKLIKDKGIGTVITTGPPHSMHLIGRRVKRKTNVKWVADFRDPWSKWDILEKLHTSSIARSIHKSLEGGVLREADVSITISNRLAKSFGGINVLHNGATVNRNSTLEPHESYFTIGFFGMLNELKNPRQFWHLLDQMCRENRVFSNKLKIRIGGIISDSIKEEIRELDELKNKVEFLGYLPHDTIQDEYRQCNLLLLLLHKTDNSQWILPVKFFEYLSARRLILGLGSRNGDLGDIMNSKDVGEILAYTELDGIRGFIEDVFENDRLPKSEDTEYLLDQFSHKNLVKRLEDLLK